MSQLCAHGRCQIEKRIDVGTAVVPIGSFVQDIEVISLVPHGRSRGGIQVGIGGKTARDRDGLGAPAIGLHRSVEPVGASGRNPRQQYHHYEETRSIYPFGCFAVHKDFLNIRYFLYLFPPASSIKELTDSLSSRVQPISRF